MINFCVSLSLSLCQFSNHMLSTYHLLFDIRRINLNIGIVLLIKIFLLFFPFVLLKQMMKNELIYKYIPYTDFLIIVCCVMVCHKTSSE